MPTIPQSLLAQRPQIPQTLAQMRQARQPQQVLSTQPVQQVRELTPQEKAINELRNMGNQSPLPDDYGGRVVSYPEQVLGVANALGLPAGTTYNLMLSSRSNNYNPPLQIINGNIVYKGTSLGSAAQAQAEAQRIATARSQTYTPSKSELEAANVYLQQRGYEPYFEPQTGGYLESGLIRTQTPTSSIVSPALSTQQPSTIAPNQQVNRIDNSFLGGLKAFWRDIGGKQIQENLPAISRDLGITGIKRDAPVFAKGLLGEDVYNKIGTGVSKVQTGGDFITGSFSKVEAKAETLFKNPQIKFIEAKQAGIQKVYEQNIKMLEADVKSGKITSQEQLDRAYNQIDSFYNTNMKNLEMQKKYAQQQAPELLSGLLVGLAKSPTQVGTFIVGGLTRPVKTAVETIKGVVELPSAIAQNPLGVSGQLIGSLAGQSLIYGSAAKAIGELTPPKTITKITRVKPEFKKSYSIQDSFKIKENTEGAAMFRTDSSAIVQKINPLTGRPVKTIKADVKSISTLTPNENVLSIDSSATGLIYKRPYSNINQGKVIQSAQVSNIRTTGTLYPKSDNTFLGVSSSKIVDTGSISTKIKFNRAGTRVDLTRADINTRMTRIPRTYSSLSTLGIKISETGKYSFGKSISQTYLERGKVRGFVKESGTRVSAYPRSYRSNVVSDTSFNRAFGRDVTPSEDISFQGGTTTIQKGNAPEVAKTIAKTQTENIVNLIVKKESTKPITIKKTTIIPKQERTFAIPFIKSNVKQEQQARRLTLLSTGTKGLSETKSKLDTGTKEKTRYSLTEMFKPASESRSNLNQQSAQATIAISATKQATSNVLKFGIPTLPPPTIPSITPTKPTPEKPVRGGFLFPREAQRKQEQQAYYPEVYVNATKKVPKAHWERVSELPQTKESAISQAARVVDNTISAKGRVVEAPKKEIARDTGDRYFEINRRKFRGWQQKKGVRYKTPNQIIELQKYRADSPNEVAALKKGRQEKSLFAGFR